MALFLPRTLPAWVCLFLISWVAGCSKRAPKNSGQESKTPATPLEVTKLELAKGNPGAALEKVNALLLTKPDYPEALLERARCQMALGKDQEALKDLDRVIQLVPQFTEGLLERGMLLAKTGNKDKALADLRQAMERDVMLDIYLLWRGLEGSMEARLRDDYATWNKEFTLLTEAHPNNPMAFMLRGLCHLVDGEKNLRREAFLQADADFSRAISLYLSNPQLRQFYDAWANRAFVRAFLGKEAEADADVLEARRRGPSSAQEQEMVERIAQAKTRSREVR